MGLFSPPLFQIGPLHNFEPFGPPALQVQIPNLIFWLTSSDQKYSKYITQQPCNCKHIKNTYDITF